MNKLKTYGCLFLALMCVFLIGTYADATIYGTRTIEFDQWIGTSIFGIGFLGAFLQDYKNEQDERILH